MFWKPKEGAEDPGSESLQCSFCQTSQAEVRKLIAGPDGVHICDGCVEVLGQEGVVPAAQAAPPAPLAGGF